MGEKELTTTNKIDKEPPKLLLDKHAWKAFDVTEHSNSLHAVERRHRSTIPAWQPFPQKACHFP